MVEHSAVCSVASMGETTVATMDAYWAGQKAALTDAPWVGETDKTMADNSAVSKAATWVVQMEQRSVERTVAALMDASWVDRKEGLTAVYSAARWDVLWVAQMDER